MINYSIKRARQSAGKTNDDYFVGFVEGEGMFYIGIVPSKETKCGWQVIYFFKVSQNPIGRKVLEALQKRLGCGYIKQNSKTDKSDRSLAFVVRNFLDLYDKIIPFFEGKLIIKQKSFETFKQVLRLVGKKRHLVKEGMSEIVDLAYSMNTTKRKVTKEFILNTFNNH